MSLNHDLSTKLSTKPNNGHSMSDSNAAIQIALPVPLYRQFDYLPPNGMHNSKLPVGSRVRVPFGKRKLIGIVVNNSRQSELARTKLKHVIELLDDEPVIDTSLMSLLLWCANYYQQPMGEVISSALPSVLRKGKFIKAITNTHYKVTNSRLDIADFKRAPKQQHAYQLLKQFPDGISFKDLSQHIKNWRPTINTLIKKGFVEAYELNEPRIDKCSKPQKIDLNPEQESAYKKIKRSASKFHCFLLKGVTGSGKTEVYLSIASDLISDNKQVLILVPEIGLTPQLVERIQMRLSTEVTTMHSSLGEAERARNWLSIKTGKAKVIVGTRSAIFLRFHQLKLIVVDEEHDISYKQQEGFLYNARDVAIYRAKQCGIPIILGSATPSFESLQNVRLGRYQSIRLTKRAKDSVMPDVKLIDMRSKQAKEGISKELISEIRTTLKRSEQVLLFINRRGFAPALMCKDCGWTADCSRCDAHMVYYRKSHKLKCHHCFQERACPDFCSNCNSDNLFHLGEGTQKIEEELQKVFPNYKIARIDRDNVKNKNKLADLLQDIKEGKHQILIGTQMLSKGHDFPNVTLVGILNVDQGLVSTDFRSTERLAQQIIQVAGRAGRGKKKGKVLLQTYQPEHPLLSCLLEKGYEEFADKDLAIRESCGFPPFTSMIIFRAKAHKQTLIQNFLQDIRNSIIGKTHSNLTVFGPIPAILQRKAGLYHYQLICIAKNRKILQNNLSGWLSQIQQMPMSKRVRWNIEVDPSEMG